MLISLQGSIVLGNLGCWHVDVMGHAPTHNRLNIPSNAPHCTANSGQGRFKEHNKETNFYA